MTQILVVFLVMLALVTAMSVGVIFGRKPIAGTCGGLNMMYGAEGGDGCKICGGDPNKCDSSDAPQEADAGRMSYDATRRDA